MSRALRTRISERLNYASLICFLHAISALLLILTEWGRIAPVHATPYCLARGFTGSVSLVMGMIFLRRPPSDLLITLLYVNVVFYCLVSMWVLPLYEFAYFECAIACAFLRTHRRWMYPAIFGAGAVGFLVSYRLQDEWAWTIPQPARIDWVLSIVFIFFVSVFIHQFALRASQREEEKRLRYSLIGRETTRLVHDLKGLLSAPLLLVESLQEGRSRDFEDVQATVRHLGEDMQHVREVLKQLNLLVVVKDERRPVDITDLWKAAAQILTRRLRDVRMTFPEPRTRVVFPERLHSVFFNLLLNSLEAFEARSIQDPEISIRWSGTDLVYKDNAGGLRLTGEQLSTKHNDGGLGLEIVRTELDTMKIQFRLTSEGEGIRATLSFS